MRVQRWWYRLNTTLWFVPAVLVVGLWLLSLGILTLDGASGTSALARLTLPWLHQQSAAAAQAILSTIAGAIMTVVALLFSITIVVLQLASSAYSPRLLPNFMADRDTQVVLGVYVGTFAYTMQVLQQIRTAATPEQEFVPRLAITGAIFLSLLCLSLLVYYIHYIARSIQPSSIIKGVHDHLLKALETVADQPHRSASSEADALAVVQPRWPHTLIYADSGGFLESLDIDALIALPAGALVLQTRPAVGSYIVTGTILAEIWSAQPLSQPIYTTIRGSFHVERERSTYQDPLFAIRQLADIALKALSAAINDPTTAEEAIWYLTDGLKHLSAAPFPARVMSSTDRQRWYILNCPDFEEYIFEAYDQIREAAGSQAHVCRTLILALKTLAPFVQQAERREAIARILADLEQTIQAGDLLPREKSELCALVHETRSLTYHSPVQAKHRR